MARIDPNQGLMPSLLDRLTDPESSGTSWRRGYGIEEMERKVRRDLEDLLNTRCCYPDLAARYPSLMQSLLAYGLPDLNSLEAHTAEQREAIGRVIEASIQAFEPRLRDVRAIMAGDNDGKDRTLRFRVDARLCLDPAPEVAFDTILELTTGHYRVKPADA